MGINMAPKALRLQIGIFGRTNTGKSSFFNMITGQQASLVSPMAGTTTDVFEKSMELLPIGPVVLSDTGGIDDSSAMGLLRIAKARQALAVTDIAVLVVASGEWTLYEDMLIESCERQNTPVIVVVNKIDLAAPTDRFRETVREKCPRVIECSCRGANHGFASSGERERCVREFKGHLLSVCPEESLNPSTILGDLLPRTKKAPLVVMIIPLDLETPKGQLFLQQVQTIRDCLDNSAMIALTRETEYPELLARFAEKPDLVVGDSELIQRVVELTPAGIPCTTFSILFSRFKGDITLMAEGAAALASLKGGDRVLIAEACSHHAADDDLGRVRIPRWIREHSAPGVGIDHCSGQEYPDDLSRYRVVIHCAGCALTRREMFTRLEKASGTARDETRGFDAPRKVAITNYGMAVSVLQGVIERTLSPFPVSLAAYKGALDPEACVVAAGGIEEG